MQVISNSQMKCFQECPRKHHYRYNLLKRPATDSPALYFGTLWHTLREGGALPEPMDPAIRARLMGMDTAYRARWESVELQVDKIEEEFRVPLINPETGAPSRTFELGGKVDKKVRIDGARMLMEHKTSSEDITPGSPYWASLAIDSQVSTYLDAHPDCEGVYYDVVRKPTIKLKKTEEPGDYMDRCAEVMAADPGKYFQRGTITRMSEDAEEARFDRWHIGRLIREAQVQDRHPKSTGSCRKWMRLCEYFDVCTRATTLDDPRFRTAPTPHEELGGPTS